MLTACCRGDSGCGDKWLLGLNWPLISVAAAQIGVFCQLRTAFWVSRRVEPAPKLASQQHVQSFEIEGQTDQAPLARRGRQIAQRELAEAQHFLDDANHRFDRAFAQAIDRLPDVRLEFVGHCDDRAGVGGRRGRL